MNTATSSRPLSSGPGSSNSSSIGLPSLSGLNRNRTLPEEWTLPHEWKMEKREPFENWKMDVQNQIANIATNLTHSLHYFPHPDIGRRFDYSDKVVQAEVEKRKRLPQSEAEGGNPLDDALPRFPDTQQY